MAFNCAITGIGISIILVQYQYWHIPLPELAFVTCARTGIGISEPWFCTVRLTSIHLLQIGGKFIETSGGPTNLFYGCVD
jgi:hypothetical protein